MQGLVNMLPNGPDDGGLIVCPGGHLYSEEFHKAMADEPRIPAWTPEWYGFTDNGMKWLENKGLKWVKVCAEPGDLLLWYAPIFGILNLTKTNPPQGFPYTALQPEPQDKSATVCRIHMLHARGRCNTR